MDELFNNNNIFINLTKQKRHYNKNVDNQEQKNLSQFINDSQIQSNSCLNNSKLPHKKQIDKIDIFCNLCNQKQLYIDQLLEEINVIHSEKYTLKDKIQILEEQLEKKQIMKKELEQENDYINTKIKFQTIQKQINFIEQQNEQILENRMKQAYSYKNQQIQTENQILSSNQQLSDYQNLFCKLNQIKLSNQHNISSKQTSRDEQVSQNCKIYHPNQNYLSFSDDKCSQMQIGSQTMKECSISQEKQFHHNCQLTQPSQLTSSQNSEKLQEQINLIPTYQQLKSQKQEQMFENQITTRTHTFLNLHKRNSLSESSFLDQQKKIIEFLPTKKSQSNLQNYLQQIQIMQLNEIDQDEIEQIYNQTSSNGQQINKNRYPGQQKKIQSSNNEYSHNTYKELSKKIKANTQQNSQVALVDQNTLLETNEQIFEFNQNLFNFNQPSLDNQDQNKIQIEDNLQFNQSINQIITKQYSSIQKHDIDSKIQFSLIEDLKNLTNINNSQQSINTSFSKDETPLNKYEVQDINKKKQEYYVDDEQEEEEKNYNDQNLFEKSKRNDIKELTNYQSYSSIEDKKYPLNISNSIKSITDLDGISYGQQSKEEQSYSFNETNYTENNDKSQTNQLNTVLQSNIFAKRSELPQNLIKRCFLMRMIQWIIFFMLLPISIFFSRKTFLQSLKK